MPKKLYNAMQYNLMGHWLQSTDTSNQIHLNIQYHLYIDFYHFFNSLHI